MGTPHFTLGDAFQWAQFCNAEAVKQRHVGSHFNFQRFSKSKTKPAVSFAALFTGTAVHFTLGDAFQWAQFCNAEASCGLN